MTIRRKGREIALQILYQSEWGTMDNVESAIREYARGLSAGGAKVKKDTLAFAKSLLEGVLRRKEDLDLVIARNVHGWRLDRMARVDRNILRMGAYELLYCSDIPPRVAINEAVELAKMFGSEESRAFINGVLDGVLRESVRRKEN